MKRGAILASIEEPQREVTGSELAPIVRDTTGGRQPRPIFTSAAS
jgi:hypothetical protein